MIRFQLPANEFNLPKLGRPTGVTRKVLDRMRKAKRLKHRGFSYTQIAKLFGITQQAVQYYLRPKDWKNRMTNAVKCERCGKKGSKLNCHHIDYLHDKVEILCNSCHMRSHKAIFRKRRKLTNLTKNYGKIKEPR